MKRKGNVITIDLDEWTTMAKKARDKNLSEGAIRKKVWRKRHNKGREQEEFIEIPELDLVLVRKNK